MEVQSTRFSGPSFVNFNPQADAQSARSRRQLPSSIRTSSQLDQLEFHIEPLEDRTLLAVSIFAAGATGEEVMALQVDGTTVRTWNNVGGDYDAGIYQTFNYNVDGIAPNRLRVAFLNDGTAANGGDRNLSVDRIEVDGRVIQTESPNVLSNGSWDEIAGCGSGFKQSEDLHCSNAYFDFSNVPVAGSSIVVLAAGATGEEQMQLQVDGQTVATWNNVGGDYGNRVFQSFTYQSDEVVAANRIRVAFTNDGDTAGGQDRNLRIDQIQIDGQVFQSEASNVRSTGTWRTSDGCDPGFKQSEELHCGGYFEYAQQGSSISIAAAGTTGTERVELLIDGVVVAGWNNIGGDYENRVFENFSYSASTTVSADQIRVAFVNDGNDASGNDRNVRVDGIEIDGQFFESESDTVFSTGTYRSSDGCDPGFKASEELHCGGYLQFATVPVNPGVISLATSVYSIGEEAGSIGLVIRRDQGSDGLATVDYRSFSGTAGGADFTAVSGRAIFQDGETSKTITIDVLQDNLVEGNESFTFTIDNVGGTAGLLAPRTATVTIVDDESDPGLGGFEFDTNALGSLFLDLNGNASVPGAQLRLTGTGVNEAGSAFYGQAIEFDANTSFRTSFQFQLNGGDGAGGADGFTFVLQNTIAGSDLLGSSGGGLGYAGTGNNSIAVEFDTYDNGASDTNANHIALVQNGSVTPIVSANTPFDLNDGSVNYAWIEYDGSSNVFEVYVSASNNKPSTATFSRTINLAATLGSEAYFGFTAATGGLSNQHQINRWAFEASTELVPEPTTFDAQVLVSGLTNPTSIDWSNDGRNLYIAEQRGIVKVRRDGQLQATPVIDIRGQVNGTRDRGLLDIAIHPDLAANPYLYLLYTHDPPEVNQNTGLAGPDGRGNRASRLTRVTLNAATNYTTVVPNSEVILLGTNSTWNNFNGFANSTSDFTEPPAGILPNGTNLRDFLAADSESHTVGSVEFGPDGALYVSNGDGTSYNQVDPRTVRVQDIDNLSGKVLRIDAISGAGLTDNPFYNGDAGANRSKVYQYGLRNPFRISIGPTGQVYVGDVGWTTWEEVNAGVAGSNFGWPYYEGGNGTSLRTNGYQNLNEAQAFYSSGQLVTAPALALNHSTDGINAIVVGEIYTGSAYPSQYQGDLLFNDLGQGIVRNISFDAAGNVAGVSTFATGASVVVQMKNGPDGHIYYVDLNDGQVGRWVPEDTQSAGAIANVTESDDGRQLAGVNLANRSIRITDAATGPVIINLADGIIATEDGTVVIGDEVRRIVAVGGRAADDAIHLVGTSGDDKVDIRPGLAKLDGDEIRVTARRYEQVSANGHDGVDQVRIRGGRDNDRFVASPGEAIMTTGQHTIRLFEFDAIAATAGKGGTNEAILYDSDGDDVLRVGSMTQELSGVGYQNAVTGFSQNVYHSSAGEDIAIWDDNAAHSQMMASNMYTALFGSRLAHELNGWWRLYVESTGVLFPYETDTDT